MPVPRHDRVTFSGVFGPPTDPAEIWSCSLTFAYVEALGGTTEQVAAIAAAAWVTNVVPILPTYAVLTRTRVARVSAGGLVTRLASGEYDQGDDFTIAGGTRGGPTMPLQTACAVSFSSLRPDASGKGRLFLPGLPGDVQSDFRLLPLRALAAAQAVRAVADAISAGSAESNPGAGLGVHSVVSSKGTSSTVTEYRCGLVPDTMRSRRNAMDEAYQVA